MVDERDFIDRTKAEVVARASAEFRANLPAILSSPEAMLTAIETAFANDALRAELRIETGAKMAAAARAEAESAGGKWKLLTVQGWTKARGRGRPKIPTTFFVSGISWADGPGFRYSKVSFSEDRAKAHRFSKAAASAVASQLARNYARIETIGVDA
jgi:hypothetical protein